MSGSPVYIDGRLIGAVSYALGSFATEPIAGITPIGEMVEATTRGAAAPGPRIAPIPIGADVGGARQRIRRCAPPRAGVCPPRLAGRPARHPVRGRRAPARSVPSRSRSPSAASSGPAAARALSAFDGAGFVLSPAGARGVPQDAPATSEPLRPGDPVGVALITGDLQFGATGTVTDVDGTRVLAFGHPLYNLGPASFAMTRAYVHAVLPSLNSSMKLASLGEVVGAMVQDRSTADCRHLRRAAPHDCHDRVADARWRARPPLHVLHGRSPAADAAARLHGDCRHRLGARAGHRPGDVRRAGPRVDRRTRRGRVRRCLRRRPARHRHGIGGRDAARARS